MPFVKGQSGNPAGRTKDPAKQEAQQIFRNASAKLILLAIKRAEGYTEVIDGKTVRYAGDNGLLRELVKKALPDNVKVAGDLTIIFKGFSKRGITSPP